MNACAAALVVSLWLGAAPAETKIPYYFDREITADDLKPLTLRELDLVRNTIFARQGHAFRKQWLRDYFTAQPWYHPRAAKDETKPSPRDQKNAAFVANFASAIPGDVLAGKVAALMKKQPSLTPEERIELTLASRSLGIPSGTDDAAVSPLDDPSQLDKGVIDPASLADLSRRDLRILRNLIYARRGRPFKSPILREYFERMEWYHADPKYTDARLTKTDKRNIKVVQDVESEVGGPLTDAEMSGDDAGAFMGAA
jgi:YARHG domain